MNMDQEVLARLEVLGKKFMSELPSRMNTIKDAYRRWQKQQTQEGLSEMHRYTHSLTGAGATFGCQPLSDQARQLEQHLKRLCVNNAGFNTENKTLIDAHLAKIETEISKLTNP